MFCFIWKKTNLISQIYCKNLNFEKLYQIQICQQSRCLLNIIFSQLVQFLHLFVHLQVVVKWQFGLYLPFQIILTPNHAGLIDHKNPKETEKPWQDSKFKIKAFSLPPNVILLQEFKANISWPWFVIRLTKSFNSSFVILKVLIFNVSIIRIFWLHREDLPYIDWSHQKLIMNLYLLPMLTILIFHKLDLYNSSGNLVGNMFNFQTIFQELFKCLSNKYFCQPKFIKKTQTRGIIFMGAKNTNTKKQSSILPELPDMYTEISSQHDSISHPELPAVKKYTILLNKNEKEEYQRQLKFRQQHREELIQIMYGEVLQDHKDYFKAKVYVEEMVLNLQQLHDIHFLDMMAIFHKVFKGFKILFEEYGPFQTDPRMICFNQEAVVKIWCNIKYSKPRPKVPFRMLTQKLMVESLVEIFMNKVDLDTLQIDSRRRRFKFQAETFQEVIKLIENRVQSADLIPNSINVVKNLLISGRKIKQGELISMNSQYYCEKLQKTVKFNYSKERQHSLDKNHSQPKVNFSFGRNQDLSNRSKHSKSLNKLPTLAQANYSKTLQSACIKIPQKKMNSFLQTQTSSKNTEKDTETQSSISSHITVKQNEAKKAIKFTYGN